MSTHFRLKVSTNKQNAHPIRFHVLSKKKTISPRFSIFFNLEEHPQSLSVTDKNLWPTDSRSTFCESQEVYGVFQSKQRRRKMRKTKALCRVGRLPHHFHTPSTPAPDQSQRFIVIRIYTISHSNWNTLLSVSRYIRQCHCNSYTNLCPIEMVVYVLSFHYNRWCHIARIFSTLNCWGNVYAYAMEWASVPTSWRRQLRTRP